MHSLQARFLEKLPKHSIAISFSHTMQTRNYDVSYPFRQNSDFYYLTKSHLNPAVWVTHQTAQTPHRILFYTTKSSAHQKWSGLEASTNTELAKSTTFWDECMPYENFWPWLEEKAVGIRTVFLPYQLLPSISRQLSQVLDKISRICQRKGHMAPQMDDIYTLLAPLRQIKQPQELIAMEKACLITARAHIHLMKTANPTMTESQIASEFMHHCAKEGSTEMAYPPIIAYGNHATVLHHSPSPTTHARPHDLVLVDAGCEWDMYAADITRTFPMGGTFTSPQRDIYNLVLNVEESLLEILRPGLLYSALQEHAIHALSEGLQQLGVFSQLSVDEVITQKLYEKFYFHNIGHFLGLDVHDTGPYCDQNGKSIALTPGMVITIEPGLYFFDPDSPPAYKGIGVRIEDDVLITREGARILTANAPKRISDIEELRAQALAGAC